MKIVTIVGARPQFIKAAPVSVELRKKHEELILHTGQHYDDNMSKIFFDQLQIPKPDMNLEVGSASHAQQTAEIMIGVEKYLKQEKPDLALIYGDTNSTLAAAVAASKLNIKLAHVEAGLRSFNRKMPEEINRIIADRLSNLLFCPTTTAVENLQKEGIADGVFNIGDVMFDAARRFAPIAERASTILNDLSLAPGEFILLTLHRAENTDDKQNMTNIISALFNSPKQIVFPVHPRTEKCLQLYDLYEQIKKSRHISLIEPVSYIDMIVLEKNAQKILTDSGGVQKEAYFYQVPCITLREETEWVETVSAGWNCLVGANYEKIMEAVENFAPSSPAKDFYGDGTASLKLSRILDEFKHS